MLVPILSASFSIFQPRKYPGLKAEYEDLLLKVYESPECDRSEEGDAFVPPDPNMEQLR